MLDNQLLILTIQTLAQLAPLRGVVDRTYIQRYQPTQQGRPDAPTVWIHKVSDKPIGFPQRTQTPTVGPSGITRRETRAWETTFQFSVTQPVDLSPEAYTHGDIIKGVMSCCQSDAFIERVGAYGVSVLKVETVNTTHFKNDSDRWEQSPTFDLTLKHNQIYLDSQPQISKFEFELIRVPDLAA